MAHRYRKEDARFPVNFSSESTWFGTGLPAETNNNCSANTAQI